MSFLCLALWLGDPGSTGKSMESYNDNFFQLYLLEALSLSAVSHLRSTLEVRPGRLVF